MASWKLCAVLLLCVLSVLVLQAESRRGGGGRRGGRGRNRGSEQDTLPEDDGEDGDEEMVAAGDDGDEVVMGPGQNGGRGGRGGRGRGGRGGHGGGRRGGHGGRRGGGRGHGHGGRGGRRRPMSGDKLERLMAGLSGSVGEFGLNAYREIAKTNPTNFVFSPYSVHSAMSMLLLAAGGTTKRELLSGLSIRSPVHPALKMYSESFQPGNDADDEDAADEDDEVDDAESAILAIANKIYVKPGFQYKPQFVQRLEQFYNTTLAEFEAENPEDAVNTWVEEQTRGEIVDFLEDGSITSDTKMLLVNAVYFKGVWADQFDAARTRPEPFHVTDSNSVDVDTMKRQGSYKLQHSDALGASVLELPYEGDHFAIFIILPNEDSSLSDVESSLTAELLNQTLSAEVYPNQISLEVPKFSLDTDQQMKEALQALGIQHVFDAARAKLNKLTRERNVAVDKVQHRAVIEVDEEGTVASAATGIMITRLSMPMPLKVNRPFMFVLRDKEQGINLFMGRYTDPNGDNLAM